MGVRLWKRRLTEQVISVMATETFTTLNALPVMFRRQEKQEEDILGIFGLAAKALDLVDLACFRMYPWNREDITAALELP